jgi:Streptomyces sporulation and cell division protein, SsgA
MSSTVSAELELRLVESPELVVPVVASLFYNRSDPYAIRIEFRAGEHVEWVFARDLLAMGMVDREGPGDVTVWPSADSADSAEQTSGEVLNIELSSPFGRAHFEAPIARISDFLRRTYQLVPAGEESEHIDFDAGLDELLRRA